MTALVKINDAWKEIKNNDDASYLTANGEQMLILSQDGSWKRFFLDPLGR